MWVLCGNITGWSTRIPSRIKTNFHKEVYKSDDTEQTKSRSQDFSTQGLQTILRYTWKTQVLASISDLSIGLINLFPDLSQESLKQKEKERSKKR